MVFKWDDQMRINMYLCDVSHIDSAKRAEYLDELSEYRKSKFFRLKTESAQDLSLGAGYLLKTALAAYGLNEMYVEYGFSENGKPYLLNFPGIELNISHSGNQVFAVCSGDGLTLGCDIEKVRSGKKKVAERFFTDYEKSLLNNLKTDKDKDEMFTRLWTLKESFIKCTGEGLSRPMDSFEFYEDEGEYRVRVKTGKGFIDNNAYGFICPKELDYLDGIQDSYKCSVCYKKSLLNEDKPFYNLYSYRL